MPSPSTRLSHPFPTLGPQLLVTMQGVLVLANIGAFAPSLTPSTSFSFPSSALSSPSNPFHFNSNPSNNVLSPMNRAPSFEILIGKGNHFFSPFFDTLANLTPPSEPTPSNSASSLDLFAERTSTAHKPSSSSCKSTKWA